MATTRLNDHVFVFPQDDVCRIVEVQDLNGTQLSGGATGLRHYGWIQNMYQCLYDGVVCGV